jgi:hypothetical protein
MDDLDAALEAVRQAIEEGFLVMGVPRRTQEERERGR